MNANIENLKAFTLPEQNTSLDNINISLWSSRGESVNLLDGSECVIENEQHIFSRVSKSLKYKTEISPQGAFLSLSISLKNESPENAPERILIEIPISDLKLGPNTDIGVLFNSSCGCRQSGIYALNAEEKDLPKCLQGSLNNKERKSLFSVVYNFKNQEHFFFGFKHPVRQDHNISIEKTKISVAIDIPEEFRTGEEFKTDELLFLKGDSPLKTIGMYAETFPPLEKMPEIPIGWNSWDFYCNDIDLEKIEENMDEISKLPWLKEKIKYIVLDDGWQASIGNWNVNINFKNGMAEVAESIKQKGFVPGIWLAPCKILCTAPVSQLHPDWLAKNTNGKPCVTGNGYAIDPTHPEAKEYIRGIFSKLYEEGFRFFKIDYVQDLDLCEKFYNGGSSLEAQRILMQIIKEAAPEAYLLSCGNLEASNGTVDCLRISLDIRTHWELIIRASMSLAVRYWMHKRLFINDPDFLVVRGPETSTDKILNRYSNITLIDKPLSIFEEKMPINEARVWSSMTLASGGAIFLGDRIKTLTEKGLALISRFFELHNGEAATPLDLFHGVKLPSMWIRKDKDKVMAIAINWSDEESEFEFSAEKMGIKLPQGHITEKWTQEIFESSNPGNFSFKVPSRDACVFEFKKA